MLKALGLENLELTLWVPSASQSWNPSPLKTAELLQADLAQVGVHVSIKHYDRAQQILAQERPVLPLASSLRLQAYRHNIQGLVLSPFGNASFAGVHRDNGEESKP